MSPSNINPMWQKLPSISPSNLAWNTHKVTWWWLDIDCFLNCWHSNFVSLPHFLHVKSPKQSKAKARQKIYQCDVPLLTSIRLLPSFLKWKVLTFLSNTFPWAAYSYTITPGRRGVGHDHAHYEVLTKIFYWTLSYYLLKVINYTPKIVLLSLI